MRFNVKYLLIFTIASLIIVQSSKGQCSSIYASCYSRCADLYSVSTNETLFYKCINGCLTDGATDNITGHGGTDKFEVKDIVKRNSDAVVMIYSTEDGERISLGSGFIIDSLGTILTNFHVVYNARYIGIRFANGNYSDKVTVKGYDPQKDIVVLKIEGNNHPFVELGDSSKVEIGENIVAIGNPRGLEHTVTAGIVSQIRELKENTEAIQIDAPISSGSSGGPLFDMNGKVVGIVYLSYIQGQNLNFAIPINYAKPLLFVGNEISLLSFYKDTAGKYDSLFGSKPNKEVEKPTTPTVSYYKEGVKYFEQQDYARAIEYLKKVGSTDSDYESSVYLISLSYGILKDYNKAIVYFELLNKINPNHKDSGYLLGLNYYMNKEYEKSINQIFKSLHLTRIIHRRLKIVA